ncbi:MAG TPA: ABC transporter permease [Puia sp.]|nr:ABC transporter permease [Puia sp.]
MKKIWLVIQREYLTRVKKRSFLLLTILVPLIIIGFYAAIIAISISGNSSSQKMAIVDEANLFNGKIDKSKSDLSDYTFIQNETETSFKEKYKDRGYSSFLYIPKFNIDTPAGLKIHSQSAISLSEKSKIEGLINKAIEEKRLITAQIDPAKYKAINSDISIDNAIDSEKGEKKAVAGVAYAVSFAAGILIYMILIIYGMMVMRGVMEEKMNRIAEVVVSSVKPFQLMLGKIIGIGGVGLTQFIIWLVLMFLLQIIVTALFPGLSHQVATMQASQQVGQQNMMQLVSEGIKSLPVGLMVFCFLFYFLGGYLIYASLFAAVGSAVSEDQQEAQQLTFPIMMPIILGFVIMTKAVNDPNSGLALFGSLFPLTSPVVMMGRIAYSPPAWQIILSMLLLILGFLFFTWLTAKIYRTGILMYGKKITWKEMVKWAFRKG